MKEKRSTFIIYSLTIHIIEFFQHFHKYSEKWHFSQKEISNILTYSRFHEIAKSGRCDLRRFTWVPILITLKSVRTRTSDPLFFDDSITRPIHAVFALGFWYVVLKIFSKIALKVESYENQQCDQCGTTRKNWKGHALKFGVKLQPFPWSLPWRARGRPGAGVIVRVLARLGLVGVEFFLKNLADVDFVHFDGTELLPVRPDHSKTDPRRVGPQVGAGVLHLVAGGKLARNLLIVHFTEEKPWKKLLLIFTYDVIFFECQWTFESSTTIKLDKW